MTSTLDLAQRLVDYTVGQLDVLVARHMPGWRIPGVFAGHRVGPDVAADLVFTLGLLTESGVTEVAGTPVVDAVRRVLTTIDGARTNTFYSYRVAETLARIGGLEGFPDDERSNLLDAVDSTASIVQLDANELPRNYAAVLARCEVARHRLGLVGVPEELLERTRTLLEPGYLDDSHTGIGRYDIYTGDIYLFTEPFADRLGDVWDRGARRAVDLAAKVGTTNGAAFPWGRSSGALAACLTIELGALVAGRPGLGDVPTWLARAANAFDHFDEDRWIVDGLITAHQHKSTYTYRGPFRRLQMTLDCLGKLADSAAVLRQAAVAQASSLGDAFPERDELVVLDPATNASVWAYRSRRNAFVVPLVGSTVSDYLPALHNPGLYEVPVESDLPTFVPSMWRGSRHHTAGQLPAAVAHHGDGTLTVRHEGFPQSAQFEGGTDVPPLPGEREVTFAVRGRTIDVTERLRFADKVPHALALQVTETAGRPLHVTFATDRPHRITEVDVSGLKEYRSFWAELPRVHQVDIDPAADVELHWSVTPKVRVLSTAFGHHYDAAVSEGLEHDVHRGRISMGRITDRSYLRNWDVLHLHWPEWFLGPEVERHRVVADALDRAGVAVVWTQHNLVPHSKDERLAPIYELWAARCALAIHHSDWGRDRVTDRYAFSPGTVHAVVPHPLFRIGGEPRPRADGPLRLGVVGAPRAEKRVDVVREAVTRAGRDVELFDWTSNYALVDRAVYDERLRSVDALVLPFETGDMLTTGTVGDVVGAGLPAISSDWPYLVEALGPAGIVYGAGGDVDALTRCIDRLTDEALAAAAAASRDLQPVLDPRRIARLTLDLLEDRVRL